MLLNPLFKLLRAVFWLSSVVTGSGSIICLLASFTKPQFGAQSIAYLLVAIALLYARDATPSAG
jgi:hypothetical protein